MSAARPRLLPVAILATALLLSTLSPALAVWTKVVFASNRAGNYDLYVMDANGANIVKILDLVGNCLHPRFSPDGRKIVFQNDGPRSVCTINPDGTGLRTLAYATHTDFATPDWSPDGTKIACAGGGGSTWHIYTMDANGANLKAVTTGDFEDVTPCWSPNGQKIAFISDRWQDQYNTYQSIYVMNADGSALTRITPDTGAYFTFLDWSPTAARLVSTAQVPGTPTDYNTGLVALNPDGSGLTYLTNDTPSPEIGSRLICGRPCWSTNGKKIHYASDRNNVSYAIYGTGPGGGNGLMLTDTPVFNVDPCQGPAAGAVSILGTGDHTSSCVAPGVAGPGTNFVFRARYRHIGAEPCSFMRLSVWTPKGDLVAGAPFEMAPLAAGSDWAAGVTYTKTVKLSAHGRFTYAITCSDGRNALRLPEQGRSQGPLVDRPPVLTWLGTTGYKADGFQPQSGAPGTEFTFKVKYQDLDGDPCTGLSVMLLKPGGTLLPNLPLTGSGKTWKTGVIYQGKTTLDQVGQYNYSFFVSTKYGGFNWPTSWPNGPLITAAAPALAITSVHAAPTGQGVAITLTLSTPAEVTGQVLNLAGRPVAVIPPETLPTGTGLLRWNGFTSQGTRPPDGRYLLRLTARRADGAQCETLAPLLLTRYTANS